MPSRLLLFSIVLSLGICASNVWAELRDPGPMLIAVLLLAALGYMGVRMRMSGLQRQKEQLARQVGARTEQVEQQNRILERQTGSRSAPAVAS